MLCAQPCRLQRHSVPLLLKGAGTQRLPQSGIPGKLAGVGRPLTDRERAVLDALLDTRFDGVEALRIEACAAEVVGTCGCGCPSIDFHDEPGAGMHVRVNATVDGTHDGLFLYTVGGRLGGIEYVGACDEGDPDELPDPARLMITPA